MYRIDPCTPRSLRSKISATTPTAEERPSVKVVTELCSSMRFGELRDTVASKTKSMLSRTQPCIPQSPLGVQNRPVTPSKSMLSRTQPCIPQSPSSVKKRPVTPSLKLLTPIKPTTPSLPFSPSTSTFPLSSRLQHLLVSRSRVNSWPDMTPECARGLEWDTVLEYRSPYSRNKWEYLSPLGGSPARRLFSWAFEGQLEYVSCPGVPDEVFPLTDLDHEVRHDLTCKDYEFLPSVI